MKPALLPLVGRGLVGGLLCGLAVWVAQEWRTTTQLRAAVAAPHSRPAPPAATAPASSPLAAPSPLTAAETRPSALAASPAGPASPASATSSSPPRRLKLPVAPRAEAWPPAGSATPAATLHSVISAAVNGDTAALQPLLTLEPAAVPDAAALFAALPDDTRHAYGSPEAVITTMIAGRLPTDLTRATVASETYASGDAVTVRVRLQHEDGKTKESNFRFTRGTNGWRLVVPAKLVADYRQSLIAKIAPPER